MQTPILDQLDPDLYKERVSSIRDQLASLNELEREQLLEEVQYTLHQGSLDEPIRIKAVKLILALLPDSEIQIKELLEAETDRIVGENQFTLFCFLDQVSRRLLSSPTIDIEELLRAYLMNVKSESAQAAWMAGDLLGDHWDPDRSLPILLSSVSEGRYVAGRLAALHGILQLYRRVSSKQMERIEKSVRDIASGDRSVKVQAYADYVSGKIGIYKRSLEKA